MKRPHWPPTNSPEIIAGYARAAHLEEDDVPAAMAYLQALMRVENGEYEWTETHIRPNEDRFYLGPVNPLDPDVLYFVDRPAGWDPVMERRAYRAMRASLETQP